MRFSDFFVAYKIGLKEIKCTIPFTRLPLYRKVAIILVFVFTIIGLILMLLNNKVAASCIWLVEIIAVSFFSVIDSTKRNLKMMLEQHYKPYSQKRMDMIIVLLKEYKVDIADIGTIDLLIQETQKEQARSDYAAPLKTPLKVLGTLIFPIIAYVVHQMGDSATQDEMLIMAAQLIIIITMVFSAILAVRPIIKDLVYQDYNKYNDLISDLMQVKIFYSNVH